VRCAARGVCCARRGLPAVALRGRGSSTEQLGLPARGPDRPPPLLCCAVVRVRVRVCARRLELHQQPVRGGGQLCLRRHHLQLGQHVLQRHVLRWGPDVRAHGMRERLGRQHWLGRRLGGRGLGRRRRGEPLGRRRGDAGVGRGHLGAPAAA
jgi:hypothetical protein